MRGELKLFQRFNMLIEAIFISTGQYRITLTNCISPITTHGHLPSLCQPSAKTVDFDRQLREAKRLLLFSDNAVNKLPGNSVLRIRLILRAFLIACRLLAQCLSRQKSTCDVKIPSLNGKPGTTCYSPFSAWSKGFSNVKNR